MGCLAFVVGAVALMALATTASTAILALVSYLAAAVGCIYFMAKRRLRLAYGISLGLAMLLLALLASGNLVQVREKAQAKQAEIAWQQQQNERRLDDLRANKDENFAEAGRLRAEGGAEEALARLKMVQEVDPDYAGLDEALCGLHHKSLVGNEFW